MNGSRLQKSGAAGRLDANRRNRLLKSAVLLFPFAGQRALINLRSGKSYSGEIVRLNRQADTVTQELEVDVKFDQLPEPITIGEETEASIEIAAAKAAISASQATMSSGGLADRKGTSREDRSCRRTMKWWPMLKLSGCPFGYRPHAAVRAFYSNIRPSCRPVWR